MAVLKSEKILKERNSSDSNSVTHLTLTHKALSDVSCLNDFKNLERLDLSFNNLTSLEGLKLCLNLKWLSVVQNKLQSLNGIESLVKLTLLNAGKNKLKSMDELKSLVSLRALILNDNEISLVGKLDQMKELNTLVLSRNPIRSLGDSFVKLKSITKLSLSNCQLQTINSSLKFCSELKELRLAHNEITTLSSDFARLTKLQNLDLGNNLITGRSNLKELASLVNLKNLNLHGNPVAEKEKSVTKVKHMLPNLHVFNAKPAGKPRGREVQNFPIETGYKPSLEGATEVNNESRNKNLREAHPVYEVEDSHSKYEDSASKKKQKKKRPLDGKADESGDTRDAGTEKLNPYEAKKFQLKKPKKSENEKVKTSYIKVDGSMKDKKSRKHVGGDNSSAIDDPETPFTDLFLTGIHETSGGSVGKKFAHVKVHGSETPSDNVHFAACGPEIWSKAVDKNLVHGTFKHIDKGSGVVGITIYKSKKDSVNINPSTLSPEEIGLGGASTWV